MACSNQALCLQFWICHSFVNLSTVFVKHVYMKKCCSSNSNKLYLAFQFSGYNKLMNYRSIQIASSAQKVQDRILSFEILKIMILQFSYKYHTHSSKFCSRFCYDEALLGNYDLKLRLFYRYLTISLYSSISSAKYSQFETVYFI